MDIKILNTSYQVVGLIDNANQFRWTEKYNEPGEFEIYTPVTTQLLTLLQMNYYVQIPASEYTMIIESREIKTDPEQGNFLIVKGRSLESIINRRIVFIQTTIFELDLELAFKRLIGDAFVDGIPLASIRKIPNFLFIEMFDTYIKSTEITAQYQPLDGDILGIITPLVKQFNVGYKLTLNPSTNNFEFRMYSGKDRSYLQSTNSYVVFSPTFDNLINSNYFESLEIYKTYSMVVGDDSDPMVLYHVDAGTPYGAWPNGLQRRETVTDQTHFSRYPDGSSTPIDLAEYQNKLNAKGVEELSQYYPPIKKFDAKIDVTNSFKYRTDFFLGDIVQIENEYGIKGTARIVEMTYSENLSGFDWVPTLDYL